MAQPTSNANAPSVTEEGAKFDEPPSQEPTNRPPVYPTTARQLLQEGRVLIRATIDNMGNVARAELHTSSGFASLDESAINAVKTWRFFPAKRFGTPVEAEILIPIRFTLKAS
jgi:protein TonB